MVRGRQKCEVTERECLQQEEQQVRRAWDRKELLCQETVRFQCVWSRVIDRERERGQSWRSYKDISCSRSLCGQSLGPRCWQGVWAVAWWQWEVHWRVLIKKGSYVGICIKVSFLPLCGRCTLYVSMCESVQKIKVSVSSLNR